jgi:tetratricopeptide (TPR) repeat protein
MLRAVDASKGDKTNQKVATSSRASLVTVVPALALVALTVAVVDWPVLSAQAQCFDDGEYVTENRVVQHPSRYGIWQFFTEVSSPSTVKGYYQPLPMISLMLDIAMGGQTADFRVFHRTSLVLHCLNTFLLGLLLFQQFGSVWAASVCSALFGLHPMAIEPLAWLSERKTMLATLFSLGCLNSYVQSTRQSRRIWLPVSWCCYLAALLSKPTALPLAFLLLLLDWWPLGRLSWRSVVEKVPYFLLAAVFGVISLISQWRTAGIDTTSNYTFAELPVAMTFLVSFYFGKMIWPANLCTAYSLPDPMAFSNPKVLIGVAVTLVAVAIAVAQLRRTRALFAGLLFFLIAAFPTLGVVKYTWMPAADKYVYLPAVGLLITLAWVLTAAWRRAGHVSRWARPLMTVAILLILAVEARASRVYLAKWQRTETLYNHILAHSPNTPAALNNLGLLLSEQSRSEEAIHYFREALRVFPRYVQAHFNLGTALARQKSWDDAVKHFDIALGLDPENGELEYQLALSLQVLGRKEEAITHFLRAAELRPNHAVTYYQLGVAYLTLGRIQDADYSMRRSIELQPYDAEVQINYGNILLQLGRAKEAIRHFQEAVRLRGDYAKAQNNWGAALASLGRVAEALPHFREAARLAPDWTAPFNTLAWLRATHPDPALRDGAEAVTMAEQADAIAKHGDAGILDTLAAAYAEAGDFDGAISAARRALEVSVASKQGELGLAIRKRLALYERKTPYRENPAVAGSASQ